MCIVKWCYKTWLSNLQIIPLRKNNLPLTSFAGFLSTGEAKPSQPRCVTCDLHRIIPNHSHQTRIILNNSHKKRFFPIILIRREPFLKILIRRERYLAKSVRHLQGWVRQILAAHIVECLFHILKKRLIVLTLNLSIFEVFFTWLTKQFAKWPNCEALGLIKAKKLWHQERFSLTSIDSGINRNSLNGRTEQCQWNVKWNEWMNETAVTLFLQLIFQFQLSPFDQYDT